MGVWSSSFGYAVNNCVEYGGQVFRSLQNSNTNNTPAAGSAYWQLILTSTKDGDVCFVVLGASSDINLRVNGTWISVTSVPIVFSLTNNVSDQLVAQFPLASARAAVGEYSISNNGPYRTGELRWNSNGVVGDTGVALSDSNVVDVGGDVGITFDADVDVTGTYVELTYSSTNLNASPATMKLTLQRFS